MTTTILHAMGMTCAGKSTIITALKAELGERVYPVQIGKILRARYGEAYFQGQAAPEKTREEAISIYREEVAAGIKAGAEIIIVDGQPRDVGQAYEMASSWREYPDVDSKFVIFHADHEIREARAKAGRTPGPDLDLALARMNNDYRNNYDVMVTLTQLGIPFEIVDTGKGFNVSDYVSFAALVYTTRQIDA